MNESYYIKANLINCDALYRSKVQFMSLGEMKALHSEHGLSDDIKIDQDTIISTLKLLKTKSPRNEGFVQLFHIWRM